MGSDSFNSVSTVAPSVVAFSPFCTIINHNYNKRNNVIQHTSPTPDFALVSRLARPRASRTFARLVSRSNI
jgi:hypothetical protein